MGLLPPSAVEEKRDVVQVEFKVVAPGTTLVRFYRALENDHEVFPAGLPLEPDVDLLVAVSEEDARTSSGGRR